MSYIPNTKPIEGFEEILLKDGPIGAGDAMALFDLPETTQEAFAAGWNRRHDLAAMAPQPKPSLSDELKSAVARLVQDVKSVLKGELAFTALAGNVGEVERLSDDKPPAPQAGEKPFVTKLGYSLVGRMSDSTNPPLHPFGSTLALEDLAVIVAKHFGNPPPSEATAFALEVVKAGKIPADGVPTSLVSLPQAKLSSLGIAGLAVKHFGNPIPPAAYALARELSGAGQPLSEGSRPNTLTVDWIQSNAGPALERLLELQAAAQAPIKLVVTVDAAAVVRVQGTHAVDVVVLDSELDGAEDDDVYDFVDGDGSTKYYVYGAGTAERCPEFVDHVHGLFLAEPEEVEGAPKQDELSTSIG